MRTKRNKYLLYETHGELWFLEKDQRTVKAVMLFDLEDLEFLQSRAWHINLGYARNTKTDYLHRLLMDAPDDLQVDHINGDRLDNRKKNLRLVTQLENTQNITNARTNKKSGLPLGVFYNGKNFMAAFKIKDKTYNRTFKTVEEASEWYWTKKAQVLETEGFDITIGGSYDQ